MTQVEKIDPQNKRRQLENEYGSYGCDKTYLNALRDKAQAQLGSDAVLYTTDPPEVWSFLTMSIEKFR